MSLRRHAGLPVLLFTLIFCSLGTVQADEPHDLPRYAPGRVLVKLRPGASVRQISGGNLIPRLGVFSVPVPEGKEMETVKTLRKDPEVEYAELNYLVRAFRSPDDPLFDFYQWNLRTIRTEAAWNIEVGKNDAVIAVLDTGVDYNHPDLAAKLLPGLNLLNQVDTPQDDNGHGTHVAGIAAAIGNNGLGIAGLSWGARILPVKVLDEFGYGSVEDLARGIIWAADNGARVINVSGGTEGNSQTLQDAVRYAYDTKGVVIVAAVGNEGGFGGLNPPLYPAALPGVMGVAATDSNDRRAEFSERGDFVAVAAPGVIILSTVPRGKGSSAFGSDYAYSSGTSMASPHVAGLAALLLSANPLLTNKQVARLIEDTATDLGPPGKDEFFGYGRIDAYGAVRSATTGIMSSSPESLGFLYEVSSREAITKSVSLANLGGVGFDWTAAINPTVPWLTISPSSGHLDALGPPQTLAVTAQLVRLTAAGTYTASVVVTGLGNVQETPLALPVSLRMADRLEKLYYPLVLHGQAPGW